MASMVVASMASMASNGGFDGVDGVEWWFGGLVASMASMVGVDRRWWTGVFDTEGTDVEVPLSPVVRMARTAVACSLFEQDAGCQ